jgi:two-component system cell cycle response regulator
VSKPSVIAFGSLQLINLDEISPENPAEHHLRNPHPVIDTKGLLAKISNDYLNLSSIISIDRAGRIQQGDAVFHCQSASRPDLRFIPLRELNEKPCRNKDNLSGRYHDRLIKRRQHISSCRTGTLILRNAPLRLPFYLYRYHFIILIEPSSLKVKKIVTGTAGDCRHYYCFIGRIFLPIVSKDVAANFASLNTRPDKKMEKNQFDASNTSYYEKKIYDLRNLIEIGMSLASNLDFHNLVEAFLYTCIGQMFVEKVVLMLQVDIDENDYSIHMVAGYEQSFDQRKVIFNEQSPLIRYLHQHPLPVEVHVLQNNESLSRDLEKIAVLSPKLIIPVRSKNILNGILLLGPRIDGTSFSNDHKEFLIDLSKFAAIAVENSRLYRMATLDRMTRLYIHHYFQERLQEEIKRSERYSTPLSLIMADIDHFKMVNDRYGHQQGDTVLKALGSIFRENLRKTDIAARYGGEEFAFILPETKLSCATDVASRLRKRVENHEFPGQEAPLRITISLGVAEYDINRDLDASRFIKRADRALYRAKRSGRNRVGIFR